MTTEEARKINEARIARQWANADKPRDLTHYCPNCGRLTGDVQRQKWPEKYHRPDILTVTFLEYGSTCPLCKAGASISIDDLGNRQRLGQFGAAVNYDAETGEAL